jgi:hypothetical protein
MEARLVALALLGQVCVLHRALLFHMRRRRLGYRFPGYRIGAHGGENWEGGLGRVWDGCWIGMRVCVNTGISKQWDIKSSRCKEGAERRGCCPT